MSPRTVMFTVAAFVGAIACGAALTPRPQIEANAPGWSPVDRGGVYEVIWDCYPQGIGCTAELLRVERTYGDWVDTTRCDPGELARTARCSGNRWRVNLGRAISLRPYTAMQASGGE